MMDEQHSLPEGTVLGKYQIINILGEGGFGITYLAVDVSTGWRVVIKEYFPSEFAIRKGDSSIVAKTSSKKDFKRGQQRFKEEAKILSRFDHPSIVKILGYFEANNTAYFVMEYEDGLDLSQYLRQIESPVSQEEIISLIMPILEGLKEVHRHRYLHRDIKPANILLRDTKLPVLIDFGASKQTMGDVSKSVTSMLTEGYAPLEQYSTDVKQQGPFTDLYAIGAVIYRMISGKVPPSAQTRSYQLLQDGQDPLILLGEMNLPGYDGNFLYAVDRTLLLKGKDRPQSVQEFQNMLMGMQEEVDDSVYENWDDLPPRTYEHISKEFEYMPEGDIFSFEGILHRLGYLTHTFIAICIFIAGLLFMVVNQKPLINEPSTLGILFAVLSFIVMLWISFAALVKRTRDLEQSIPLFIFLSLIPYINFIIVIILLLAPSKYLQDQEHEY
jgi:serine/threonine protein kinase